MKLPRFITIPICSLAALLLAALLLAAATGLPDRTGNAQVPVSAGSFHSVLPEAEGEPVHVEAFKMDETAVTNRQFSRFLEANPGWRRSQITPLYAESGYLQHWSSELSAGTADEETRPVTRVSWFAANAYCGWAGGRLPTLNEWEYAAQAMDFSTPADADRFAGDLIGWYSAVDAVRSAPVGSTGIINRYGVQDLFGLIMEWVEDFRPPVGSEISLDCGTMGKMTGDASLYSYAMSIRYVTRMSFRPTSTTGMMGFRCAYDTPASEEL